MPRLKSIFHRILELVFPRICFHCGIRLEKTCCILCSECDKQIAPQDIPICSKCGQVGVAGKEQCPYCTQQFAYFDKCRSVSPFNEVARTVIHELKFNDMTKTAQYLAVKAIRFLESENPFEKVDLVMAVPLHSVRERARGFNQSDLIAAHIAEYFSWEYVKNLLQRKRYTSSQTFLNPEERKKNVDNAFSVDNRSELKDRNILIIDDVFTTGSTVNSISKTLKEIGANKVFILTIARA